MSARALVADIGGTNARFALCEDGRPGEPVVLRTDAFPGLADALEHALTSLRPGRLQAVAACAAGPPRDGIIRLTNHAWEVSEAVLRRATGARDAVLVNDFTALAAALPVLAGEDLRPVGGGEGIAGAARAVIGPGTGLGMSAWVPGAAHEALITGEGGHADLAPGSDEEDAILARLRQRHGHVSAERVLSGPGLVELYRAMYPQPAGGERLAPDAISERAAAGDPQALACIARWSRWLGAVAGNLALIVGARGGIYLAGGILPAWGALFPAAEFRAGFEAKGRYRDYVAAIPTSIIVHPFPALTGLARLLATRLHAP